MQRRLNLNKLRDLIIYPFYECNLNCKGCPVRKPIGEIGFLASPYDAFEHHISYEYIERIKEWNVKYITILGGEPFLSVSLPEILSALRESNSKIVVYTNASLLAKEEKNNLREVLELIDYLTISLEGDAFWTSRIRGKKVFEWCMSVLDKIGDMVQPVIRSGYWNETICERCNSPLLRQDYCSWCGREPKMRDQLTDLIKMIDFFNEQDIPVEVAPRFGSNYTPLPRARARWFYAALASCKMADCLLPAYKNYLGLKITCPAGWSRLTVDPEGYITGCQWDQRYFAHLDMDDDQIVECANRYVSEHNIIMPECYGCSLAEECRSSCKIVMDYKACPVRDYSLDRTDDAVRIGSEIRPLSSIKAIKNLKAMRRLSPGVC